VAAPLPLSALLSQVLVAFIIECDNEFEHRMPHRTSDFGSTGRGLWLTSMAMWWTCMRFIGPEGVPVRELEKLARTAPNLNGMLRWGYITVQPDPSDRRPKPPRSAWIIRATANGRLAQEVWQPLVPAIEARWRARFSADGITRLRECLEAIIAQIPFDFPGCLPILGYGLFVKDRVHVTPRQNESSSGLELPALLAQVLIAFALEYENASLLSLAISANVLRVLNEEGVRMRDLPRASGVSKESIAMAMGILKKRHCASVAASVVRLTAQGLEAQQAYHRMVEGIEKHWEKQFGSATLRALRATLASLSGKLSLGLDPYPDNWRAKVRKPDTLPHFPMVLHRGGYPDGS